MRLKKINQSEPKPLTVVLPGGAVIHCTYTRDKYTPKFERELAKYREKQLPGSYLANMILACVTSWDITTDQEGSESIPEDDRPQVPLPLTREILDNEINIDIQSAIVMAIATDASPKPKTLPDTDEQF